MSRKRFKTKDLEEYEADLRHARKRDMAGYMERMSFKTKDFDCERCTLDKQECASCPAEWGAHQ